LLIAATVATFGEGQINGRTDEQTWRRVAISQLLGASCGSMKSPLPIATNLAMIYI